MLRARARAFYYITNHAGCNLPLRGEESCGQILKILESNVFISKIYT